MFIEVNDCILENLVSALAYENDRLDLQVKRAQLQLDDMQAMQDALREIWDMALECAEFGTKEMDELKDIVSDALHIVPQAKV